MIICILGRQPALGLAELESRFGTPAVLPLGAVAAQVNIDAAHAHPHSLGGVIKAAKPLVTLNSTDWGTILDYCRQALPALIQELPEGKFKLGLSVYDLKVSLKSLQRSGLELKKAIRATGRSVRIVPNTALELNSAQILHNLLTSELGMELLFIRDGKQTHIAQTFAVQDIDDYARRDFGRPKRDAFVGMLPPKLAQTMLNLAQAEGKRVLDPFCGTGVVLQEAALMNCSVYGTDVSERMVRFSRENLSWLRQTYRIEFNEDLEVADATTATWQTPLESVVCESYLGKPLTFLPDRDKLGAIMIECDKITEGFLINLRRQLAPGTRCCVAIPAWYTGKGFLHLRVVDYLEKMGYNRVSFSCASNDELIYHRNDQIVGRELLVLTVKE